MLSNPGPNVLIVCDSCGPVGLALELESFQLLNKLLVRLKGFNELVPLLALLFRQLMSQIAILATRLRNQDLPSEMFILKFPIRITPKRINQHG